MLQKSPELLPNRSGRKRAIRWLTENQMKKIKLKIKQVVCDAPTTKTPLVSCAAN